MTIKSNGFVAAFTIVELLLALAITSLLLAAAAIALNASVTNYEVNEDIFEAINDGRQALFRITRQLRTAQLVVTDATQNECTLTTADGENITYRYDSAEGKLYVVTNDDASDSDYLLCDGLAAMSFTKNLGTRDGDTYVKSVQISVTISRGDLQRKLCAAAVIRRNLE